MQQSVPYHHNQQHWLKCLADQEFNLKTHYAVAMQDDRIEIKIEIEIGPEQDRKVTASLGRNHDDSEIAT